MFLMALEYKFYKKETPTCSKVENLNLWHNTVGQISFVRGGQETPVQQKSCTKLSVTKSFTFNTLVLTIYNKSGFYLC